MYSLILALGGFDFGYTWPWTHGHLVVAAILGVAASLAWFRFRALRTASALAIGIVWALAAFLVVQFGFRFTMPVALPTEQFLRQGTGRVLDMGSGSGRATVMVLLERPQARVVALDNWSADYIEDNSPRLLLANASVAGAADRVEAVTGDMRRLPFEDEVFEGIVSTYAIDHLSSEGVIEALAEAFRVLKPGGEFLLMVINGDYWLSFVYGPLAHLHGFRYVDDAWAARLSRAGFDLVERGRRPGTAYFLVRRPGTPAAVR